MASDISLAVGDGARRMTYTELAAVRGISAAGGGRARPAMTALSGYLSPSRKRAITGNLPFRVSPRTWTRMSGRPP
jgi:hypothetical protein